MSGHNGLYFALLRYDAQQVLERQSVQVCELPRALLARFSFAELQQAVLSLAADIPPAALRDVATYCEEASLLRTRPKGSRDAVHFLGRALETSAIASAIAALAARYGLGANEKSSLKQLAAHSGPQVLAAVAQSMCEYAGQLEAHALRTRRATHNLAVLRRANADVYRVLTHVLRERRPQERAQMQQRARKLRAAASLPSTPAPAVPVGGMRALTLEPPRCSTSVGKRQGSGGAAAGSSQVAAARGQAQGGGATTQRRCECGPAAGDTGGLRGSGDAAGAPAADAGHARADGGESRSGSVPRSMSSGSLQGARRCAADAA